MLLNDTQNPFVEKYLVAPIQSLVSYDVEVHSSF